MKILIIVNYTVTKNRYHDGFNAAIEQIKEMFLTTKNIINSKWKDIYKKGVIQNNGNIEGKDPNYVIYVDNGDGSSARYLTDFFTINQATEEIKKINISSRKDYNEAVNLLIEALTQNILFKKLFKIFF